MYAWWFATRSLGVIVVVVVYCCRLWLPVEAGGYHCTGTAGPGNQFFKCTAMTTSDNSNHTSSNQTVIDYTSNQTGPDVSIDADRTLLVNLKVQNVSAVHVLVIRYAHGTAELKNNIYRLLKPIIIKQMNPKESYNSSLINYVNGSLTEEDISKKNRNNYVGCDSGKLHPTCGIQYNGYGEPIPFSELIVDNRTSYVSAGYEGAVMEVGVIQLEENTFINDKVMLQISEIHAIYDNQPGTAVEVRVYVTNLGLVSAGFSAIISDQPKSCRKSVVHPQQTVEVHLPFECSKVRCDGTVDLYDGDAPSDDYGTEAAVAVVASRRFGVTRGSRCYCSWHRRCLCHNDGDDDDVSGRLFARSRSGGSVLGQREYGRAGFPGDAPPGLTCADDDEDDRVLAAGLELLGAYAAVVLSLGLIKAVWPRYRPHWLWMVTSNWLPEMRAYREPELRPCQLVRDAGGYYVHPVTRSRNIRLMDGGQQLVVNVLFFFVLPTAYCLYRRRTSAAYRCPTSDSLLTSTVRTGGASGCSERRGSAPAGDRTPAASCEFGGKPQHSAPASPRNAS